MRARYEMKKAGFDIPSINDTGGIDISMSTPFHIDRLGLIYTRTYNELKGITNAMSQQISRVLAEGMMNGDGAKLLARKLVGTINGAGMGELGLTDSLGRFIPAKRRAEIMARTEIIRSHHVATIQEYKNWELEGVYLKAEFTTAGDERVCDICAALEGNKYTLDEAEGIIPVHPQCFADFQTPIYTSKGWKQIGNIKVGDLVLTHKKRFRKVTQLIRNKQKDVKLYYLHYSLYDVEDYILEITGNHPILINDKWKETKDIQIGDEIKYKTFNNEFISLSIDKIGIFIEEKKVTLYNFSVEEDESYIAKGIVVHNCRCIMLPYRTTSKKQPIK